MKILVPVLLIIAVLISGCASSSTQSSNTVTPVHTAPPPEQTSVQLPLAVTVLNEDFAFYPAEVVIARGGTVTWKQKDYEMHTVTGSDFKSSELSKGQTYSHTFNEVGTYEYRCTLHPDMKGKVIVK